MLKSISLDIAISEESLLHDKRKKENLEFRQGKVLWSASEGLIFYFCLDEKQ